MKLDFQTIISWKLDDARSWLKKNRANVEVQIIEIAPPAKPPRRENAQPKSAPTRSASGEATKSRERAGDWRVLRCRYLEENNAASTCASTCSAIEIVTAREILRND